MNKRGNTSITEIIFIVAMVIPTVLMGVFKIWPLFWVFVIFDIIFGIVEVCYAKFTGKTVSQHFWEWSKKHKAKAIAILASMGIMWTFLILHLGSKLFQ